MSIFQQFLIIFVFVLPFFFVLPATANAIENPLNVPNNKVGIHILFPSELPQAATLINSNDGDWGYVIIPIQAGEKDIFKWQQFMDSAKKHHVIPIVRLATEGDYFNTEVWRKPEFTDIVDFANFLNSLSWPTKNRYISVFNEVNRANEWGGSANPAEYAEILSFAVTAFKSKNPDFFLISSGMDNASITANKTYNQFDFFRKMNQQVPGIFRQIDGMGSHSYPNPAFSQPPTVQTHMSITSFRFEKKLLESLGASPDLPVFITETGWSTDAVSEKSAALYYKTAFEEIWSDSSVVAVTPFLLRAGAGPFAQFSFFNAQGSPNEQYKVVASLQKVKGKPVLAPEIKEKPKKEILGEEAILPLLAFSTEIRQPAPPSIVDSQDVYRQVLKWALKMN